MTKLVYVATLMLCMTLIRAEGNADPMESIKKLMAMLQPSVLCPKVCGDACSMEDKFCVDIPEVRDCAAKKAACQGICDEMCGCVNLCDTSCPDSCEGVEAKTLESITCKVKNGLCKAGCEAKCPADQVAKQADASQKQLTAVLGGLMQQIQGMMKPPAEH